MIDRQSIPHIQEIGPGELVGHVRRPPATQGCQGGCALSMLSSLSFAQRGRLFTSSPFAPSPRTIMSIVPSVSTSRSNFVSVFDAALETYKRRTKKDLATHSLLPTLQSCDSPEAVLVVLREQIPAFSPTQNDDDGLTKWVSPTVNVLYTISANLGGGVGLVSNYDVSLSRVR